MRLYELQTAVANVSDLLEEGAIDQTTAQDTLDSLLPIARDKGLNIAALVQNEEADIAAMKEAEQRMAKRRKAKEAKIAWLEKYLLDNMNALEWTEISSPEFVVKVVTNPPKVEIAEGVELPEEFVVTSTSTRPDKVKLKKHLKEGDTIEGVSLITTQRIAYK